MGQCRRSYSASNLLDDYISVGPTSILFFSYSLQRLYMLRTEKIDSTVNKKFHFQGNNCCCVRGPAKVTRYFNFFCKKVMQDHKIFGPISGTFFESD